MVDEEGVRSLEVLAVSADHDYFFDELTTLLLHLFFFLGRLECKIIHIIKLKLHAGSNKRRRDAVLSEMAFKNLAAVKFLPQVKDFAGFVAVGPEIGEIQGANLVLQFKIAFFSVVEPSKDEDLIFQGEG